MSTPFKMKGPSFFKSVLKKYKSSPVKDGTMARMTDPPQYPKHYHEGRKVVETGGWTTDAGAQHTKSTKTKKKKKVTVEQAKKLLKED